MVRSSYRGGRKKSIYRVGQGLPKAGCVYKIYQEPSGQQTRRAAWFVSIVLAKAHGRCIVGEEHNGAVVLEQQHLIKRAAVSQEELSQVVKLETWFNAMDPHGLGTAALAKAKADNTASHGGALQLDVDRHTLVDVVKAHKSKRSLSRLDAEVHVGHRSDRREGSAKSGFCSSLGEIADKEGGGLALAPVLGKGKVRQGSS